MSGTAEQYWNFFNATLEQVEKARATPERSNEHYNQSKVRALQIFKMEIYLRDYRAEHATPWERLSGLKAAHHRVLTRFKWTIPFIESLTVEQLFFALHDDLKNHPISAAAEQALASYNLQDMYQNSPPPDFQETEWLPEIADRLLPKI